MKKLLLKTNCKTLLIKQHHLRKNKKKSLLEKPIKFTILLKKIRYLEKAKTRKNRHILRLKQRIKNLKSNKRIKKKKSQKKKFLTPQSSQLVDPTTPIIRTLSKKHNTSHSRIQQILVLLLLLKSLLTKKQLTKKKLKNLRRSFPCGIRDQAQLSSSKILQKKRIPNLKNHWKA